MIYFNWNFPQRSKSEVPMFFSGKNYEFDNKDKKRSNFETAKGRNLNFRT